MEQPVCTPRVHNFLSCYKVSLSKLITTSTTIATICEGEMKRDEQYAHSNIA